MNDIISQLKVIPSTGINTNKDGLSEEDFHQSHLMQNDKLNLTLTHLYGDQFGQDLMLHQLTIARAIYKNDESAIKKHEMNTLEYEWDVMGRVFTNALINFTPYASTDLVGDGGVPFYVWFDKNIFDKGYTIESPNNTQIRLYSSGEPDGNGWKYEARVQNKKYVPWEDLQPGTEWSQFFSVHSAEDSEPVESGYRVLPGRAKNQMCVVRASRTWKGNVANKKLTAEVPAGKNGEKSYYWIDQDQFFFDLFWMKAKETVMMYGEYNKSTNGTVALKEDNGTGSVIRVGAGFLQQIPNTATYSGMTFEYLRTLIMDMYFLNPETAGKHVVIVSGQGGCEEIDRACKDFLSSTGGSWNTTNDKQVSGEKDKLELNGYFSKIYFIGGYTLEVVHDKLFDYGARAQKSHKHPTTGLPLESYRMVFVDPGAPGDANIQYVNERGRELLQAINQGLTPNPKGLPAMGDKISTGKTKSSLERIGTCGIALTKPTYSFNITYDVSTL